MPTAGRGSLPATFDDEAFALDPRRYRASSRASHVAHENYVAYGVRHQPRGSRAPTVYLIADRRLNS